MQQSKTKSKLCLHLFIFSLILYGCENQKSHFSIVSCNSKHVDTLVFQTSMKDSIIHSVVDYGCCKKEYPLINLKQKAKFDTSYVFHEINPRCENNPLPDGGTVIITLDSIVQKRSDKYYYFNVRTFYQDLLTGHDVNIHRRIIYSLNEDFLLYSLLEMDTLTHFPFNRDNFW